ncbi:LAFA_0G13036g1_1 [Lachancea sp. 'fantastica']|nr:LAFA_0G13036g1_1 [Lachancea sp. 'fantastica']
MLGFEKLFFKRGELNLNNVLHCGQAFRWIFHEKLGEYSSTLRIGGHYRIVVLRQKSEDFIEYATVGKVEEPAVREFLRRYFRLEVDLTKLYTEQWLSQDHRFERKKPNGVRIMSQDPWETLVSYICSSNNNISRITKMCHALCTHFGNPVGHYDGVDHYSFPTSREITQRASEDVLRKLGFGYRAKFIVATAQKMEIDRLSMSDSEYLESWKDHLQYEQVREKIMSFNGVGPKVADCVCLSGLRMDDVVPVDVHIARIAQRDYKFSARKQDIEELQKEYKNLPITRKKVNYELDLTRAMFKQKWGEFAGWAQGVLFAAEIGKSTGASSDGTTLTRKTKLDYVVKIKEETTSLKRRFSQTEDMEVTQEDKTLKTEIEYSVTGRPKRRTTKNVEYVS